MKDNYVGVKFDNDDYAELLMKVEAANMNMSEYIRKAVKKSEVTAINQDLVEIEEAKLYLFNKASNNINQIAKYLNSQHKIKGHITEEDLEKLKEELKNILDMLRGV